MISTELLKVRRKELGLTQEEVADKISIGRSQYANIELGNSNPSISILIEIIKLFDISFEELFIKYVSDMGYTINADDEIIESLHDMWYKKQLE